MKLRPDHEILRALILAQPITDDELVYVGVEPLPDEDPALTRYRRALVMSSRANGDPEDPAGDLAWIDEAALRPNRDHLRARSRR